MGICCAFTFIIFPFPNNLPWLVFEETKEIKTLENIAENFVLIPGGTFQMGSPETENWRSEDETQHTVEGKWYDRIGRR